MEIKMELAISFIITNLLKTSLLTLFGANLKSGRKRPPSKNITQIRSRRSNLLRVLYRRTS